MLGNYADYEALFLAIVAVPSVLAEGWFGLWLLLRAGKGVRNGSGARNGRTAAPSTV